MTDISLIGGHLNAKAKLNSLCILYFAYGANLNRTSMRHRCPGCEPLYRATLPDYRLVFRGVADVEPMIGAVVEGVLYRISAPHLRLLDIFEGYPSLYIRKELTVVPDKRPPVFATLYQMREPDPCSPPYGAYLSGIIEGCRQWGIPESFVFSAADSCRELSLQYSSR